MGMSTNGTTSLPKGCVPMATANAVTSCPKPVHATEIARSSPRKYGASMKVVLTESTSTSAPPSSAATPPGSGALLTVELGDRYRRRSPEAYVTRQMAANVVRWPSRAVRLRPRKVCERERPTSTNVMSPWPTTSSHSSL